MKRARRPARKSSGKWDSQYRALTAIRIQLLAQEAERSGQFRTGSRTPDPGDVAENAEENADLLAAIRHEEAELTEIDAALGRIRDGTYGRCEATGRRIPLRRLRAVPWTRFTQQAAAQREKLAEAAR